MMQASIHKTALSKRLIAGLWLAALTLPAVPAFGQGFKGPGERISLPMDWSTRHLIYTRAFTPEQAQRMNNDPRLYNSWLLQGHGPQNALAPKHGLAAATTPGPQANGKPQPAPAKTVDWSFALGSLGVAKNMSPAKFNFDVNATPSCTNDFVVFGLNGAGSATQANLVAINNLYSNLTGPAFCGASPTALWAYNVTTTTGGAVTTSPVLSLDGTKVAFIESAASATILHVLKWASGGTVGAPVTPSAAADIALCTAPCMTSLTLDSSAADTNSSIFPDYGTGTFYVGNNVGRVFKVTGGFTGAPALSNTNGFGALCGAGAANGCKSVGSPTILTSPIYDGANIFVGTQSGAVVKIDSAGALTAQSIGVTSGIKDPPIVDVSNGVIYTAASNSANAIVIQSDLNLSAPSTVTATIGASSATNPLHGGTFDNDYFNWPGDTSGNTGHLIACGNPTGIPTLYSIPFSRLTGLAITNGGSGYTSMPALDFSTGGGTGGAGTVTGKVTNVAVTGTTTTGYTNPTVSFNNTGTGGVGVTATVSGGLFSIAVTAAGSNFSSVPGVSFTGNGAATAIMGVGSLTLTAGGSGFTSIPGVTFTGDGTGAASTAALGVNAVTVTNGGSNYTSIPSVTSITGGTATASVATVGVAGVTLSNNGAGYTAVPSVGFTGSGAGGATAGASVGVNAINLTAAGAGYTSVPSVDFTGTGTAATATAGLGVNTVTVNNGGSGYTSIPTVTSISGGTATASVATVGVSGVTLTNGGGAGYQAIPSVAFAGSGAGGASGTVTAGVDAVSVTAAGAGYTSVPSVVFAPSGATATAALGVNTVTVSASGSGYAAPPTVSIPGGTVNAGATAVMGVVSYAIGTNTGTFNTTSAATASVPTVTVAASTVTATATTTYTLSAVSLGANTGDTCTSGTYNIPGGISGSLDTVTVTAKGSGQHDLVSPFTFTAHGRVYNSANPPSVPSGICSVTAPTFNWNLTLNTIVPNVIGSGYTSQPAVTFSSPAPTATVTVTDTLGVVSVTVNTPGTGYTSVPTVSFASGSATATADLKVVSAAVNTPGSYTTFPTVSFSGGTPTSAATATDTVKVLSVGSIVPGSYTTFPTVSFSGGTPATAATATATAKVLTVSVTAAGTGYTTGPATVNFSASGGSGAAATADLKVVSVTINTAGAYTTFPTIAFSGGTPTSTATATLTARVVSVAVTAPGSYTTFPGVTFTGGTPTISAAGTATATVLTVTVTAPGTGYTTGPATVNFSASGGSGAAATADLKIVSLSAPTAGSGYTTPPTVGFSGGGGTGASATDTLKVVSVAVTTPGSGYTSSPGVTISGGGGSGATASAATLDPTTIAITANGSGYLTPPTVTITGSGAGKSASATLSLNAASVTTAGSGYDQSFAVGLTGGGGTGGILTATAAAGNVMPSGTPSVTKVVPNAPSGAECSPITEIFTNSSKDLIFWGAGSSGFGQVSNLDVTVANLSATPNNVTEPSAAGGVTAIAVDNIAWAAIATWTASASHALGDLIQDSNGNAQLCTTAGTSKAAPAPVWSTGLNATTADGSVVWTNKGPNFGQAASIYFGTLATTAAPAVASITQYARSSGVSTITTLAAHNFLPGDTVTVAGVNGDTSFEGTFSITSIPTSTTFTYSQALGNVAPTSANNGGRTATVSAARFTAVKLTQASLQ